MTTIVTLLDVALYVWWYFLSLKLWKINPKFRIQLFGGQEYIDEITAFKMATSRDDLDTKYSKAIVKWPNLEKFSTQEYKLKKAEFSKK